MSNSAIPKPIILKNRNNAPKPTTAEDVRKDIEWLKLHHREYQGQWIAIHKGVLLGANKDSLELYKTIETAGQLNQALFISLA
jgi:hydrogenase maturation factor